MAHFAIIGPNKIQLQDDQQNLTPDQLKEVLRAAYPEVINATARERTLEDGLTTVIDYLPQPGRKG